MNSNINELLQQMQVISQQIANILETSNNLNFQHCSDEKKVSKITENDENIKTSRQCADLTRNMFQFLQSEFQNTTPTRQSCLNALQQHDETLFKLFQGAENYFEGHELSEVIQCFKHVKYPFYGYCIHGYNSNCLHMFDGTIIESSEQSQAVKETNQIHQQYAKKNFEAIRTSDDKYCCPSCQHNIVISGDMSDMVCNENLTLMNFLKSRCSHGHGNLRDKQKLFKGLESYHGSFHCSNQDCELSKIVLHSIKNDLDGNFIIKHVINFGKIVRFGRELIIPTANKHQHPPEKKQQSKPLNAYAHNFVPSSTSTCEENKIQSSTHVQIQHKKYYPTQQNMMHTGYYSHLPQTSHLPQASQVMYPGIPQTSQMMYPGMPQASQVMYPGMPQASQMMYPGLPQTSQMMYPGTSYMFSNKTQFNESDESSDYDEYDDEYHDYDDEFETQ
jgi:hypothetical protein